MAVALYLFQRHHRASELRALHVLAIASYLGAAVLPPRRQHGPNGRRAAQVDSRQTEWSQAHAVRIVVCVRARARCSLACASCCWTKSAADRAAADCPRPAPLVGASAFRTPPPRAALESGAEVPSALIMAIMRVWCVSADLLMVQIPCVCVCVVVHGNLPFYPVWSSVAQHSKGNASWRGRAQWCCAQRAIRDGCTSRAMLAWGSRGGNLTR